MGKFQQGHEEKQGDENAQDQALLESFNEVRADGDADHKADPSQE